MSQSESLSSDSKQAGAVSRTQLSVAWASVNVSIWSSLLQLHESWRVGPEKVAVRECTLVPGGCDGCHGDHRRRVCLGSSCRSSGTCPGLWPSPTTGFQTFHPREVWYPPTHTQERAVHRSDSCVKWRLHALPPPVLSHSHVAELVRLGVGEAVQAFLAVRASSLWGRLHALKH